MKFVLSAEEAKHLDRESIEKYGMPSLVLMERAALSMRDFIRSVVPKGSRILVLGGRGNNGGDGYALARMLDEDGGFSLTVFTPEKSKRFSEDASHQLSLLRKRGVKVLPYEENGRLKKNFLSALKEADLLVDALYGIGLMRVTEGTDELLLEAITEERRNRAFRILSADLPSGVGGSDGKLYSSFPVPADDTFTFGALKKGHIFYPGAGYAGKVHVEEIGFRPFKEGEKTFSVWEKEDIVPLLPKRKRDSHKGSYGTLLLLGGADGMGGAAIFGGEAALRTGTGLLYLVCGKQLRKILPSALPEAVSFSMEGEIPDAAKKRASAFVFGPGLSKGKEAGEKLRLLLEDVGERPCLLDADALNLLAEGDFPLPENTLLTPHSMELARLLHKDLAFVTEDPAGSALLAAETYGVSVLHKGSRSFLAEPSGRVRTHLYGSSALSKGGSGDILSGIAGGLMAQGLSPADAGLAASVIHALLGEAAEERFGSTGTLPRDLLSLLPEIWKNLT